MHPELRFELPLQVIKSNHRWLVTGAAGFIGSHLVENLLKLEQRVVGLDNFSDGFRANLDHVQKQVGPELWRRFEFIEGDIRNYDTCLKACSGATVVLHQAAAGSVPRSIDNPLYTNENNVTGTINILVAAKESKVQRFVFASSSSVYGDNPDLPKVESKTGEPLSPYAVSKKVTELYSKVFGLTYGLPTVGLRYFNVFGARQNPNGAYAAVIPKWVTALLKNEPVFINGDGLTSRDFCYVKNVVQANILAATTENPEAIGLVYNIALNGRATLNELYELIRNKLAQTRPEIANRQPQYREFRKGDILHSQADISLAKKLLGYRPAFSLSEGLDEALAWYVGNVN